MATNFNELVQIDFSLIQYTWKISVFQILL